MATYNTLLYSYLTARFKYLNPAIWLVHKRWVPPVSAHTSKFKTVCGYRGQRYPYSHDDLDWGVQSWNYNCATQTVGNRRQILAPFVGGTIFEAFPVFHFLVYCKLAKNSRKTFSVDKVSALHLKSKQFLLNVYEAIWQWQHMPDNIRFSSPLSIILLKT